MNEKQTEEQKTVRPTKKQKELLSYIESFIAEHGYSPSYREIMSALHYNSVATVALHVGNLIKRGHLRKRAEPMTGISNRFAVTIARCLLINSFRYCKS